MRQGGELPTVTLEIFSTKYCTSANFHDSENFNLKIKNIRWHHVVFIIRSPQNEIKQVILWQSVKDVEMIMIRLLKLY